MDLKINRTKQEVADAFSKYLIAFVENRKEVHIALSGGSTPKIVFDTLAKHYTDQTDWAKVYLYWGDERCVTPEDDASNFKMTKEHLLSKLNIPKGNIYRIKGENRPEYEARRYSKVLSNALPKRREVPRFDLVILGMGDDGHTASIFPYEIDLWYSKKYCEVATHPDSGQKRITITGQVINNAQEVAFLVTGENKAVKLGEIIDKKGRFKDYPASLVNPRSGKLIWFMDQAAAANITSPHF
ncbi:6-phosphogluconolactonase [Maribacter algicola]|uniref:6-phosphogluconolactonase n=1 Tax=Meishania litoralis TaxID=3434685 RepID=A0ACC7LL14_9FLAO